MEIKGINFNFINKDKNKSTNISNNEEPKTIKTISKDSLNISSVKKGDIPTETVKSDTKTSLVSLSDKYVNQPIFNHYLSYREKEDYKFTVSKLDSLAENKASIYKIENEAINSFSYSNSGSQTLEKAYKASLATVMHDTKYSDKDFFNGERDKVFHYFTSASLTTSIYNKIPLLPKNIKAEVAGGIVWSIGFLREVVSIPGNGYGKDDMQANQIGINRAKELLKSTK